MNDFKYQISIKIGNDLLNLRTDTPEEFGSQLKWAVENAEQLQIACAAFQKPEPVRLAATSGRYPSQEGAGRPWDPPQGLATPGVANAPAEIGPIQLEGVEIKKAGRNGVPFKKSLYIVKWDGASATTFDPLVGKASMGFWAQGHPCYVTVEPSAYNPRYTNLVSIRMAA